MKWKPILNYQSIYEVSENGDVKRIAETNNQYAKGHILKHNIINGYAHVQLHKSGKVKSMRVHRLVAMAFLDNPNNKPHVNHLDGDKLNNHLSNLEWCTPSENQLHKHRVLNKTHRKYTLTTNQIDEIIKLRLTGMRLHELSYMFKIPVDTLHKLLSKNNMKTGYGGMFNGRSKLTDTQRKEIIDLFHKGNEYKNIADKYSVTINTIKRVLGKYQYAKPR
jgi:Mor family transcriptional regulator